MRLLLIVLMIANLFGQCMAMSSETPNYYETLGVNEKATSEEIKNAYKELLLKYHPDKLKKGDDEIKAKEKFEEIQKAYETLSDKFGRICYDMDKKPFPELDTWSDVIKEQFFTSYSALFNQRYQQRKALYQSFINSTQKQINQINNDITQYNSQGDVKASNYFKTYLQEKTLELEKFNNQLNELDKEHQETMNSLHRRFDKPIILKDPEVFVNKPMAPLIEQYNWYIRALNAHTKTLTSQVDKSYADKKNLFGDQTFHWTEIVNTITSILDQAIREEEMGIPESTIREAMQALSAYFDKLLTVKSDPSYKNYLSHTDFLPATDTPKSLAQRVEEYANKVKSKISKLEEKFDHKSPVEKALASLQKQLNELKNKLEALSEKLASLAGKISFKKKP